MLGMYPDGGISGASLASGLLRTSTGIGLVIAACALAAPASAAAEATLAVDEVAPCYREQSAVHLVGGGFTQNGEVKFERDGTEIFDREGKRIHADPSGALFPQLTLPGLSTGQRTLTYVVTDVTNPALTAQVSLLVSATDVGLRPQGGAPHRLLRVTARGFFGGRTLYAHVIRAGRHPRSARNLRIGRVSGPCKTVQARKRLFSRSTPAGKYRVQFDTFRRYQAKPRRAVRSVFNVTVFPSAGTAKASAVSPAS